MSAKGRRPAGRMRGAVGIALGISCLLGTSLRAGFGEPLKLTGEEDRATETILGLDPAGNVFVVSLVEGAVVVDIIGPKLRATSRVEVDGSSLEGIDIATNFRGQSYIGFGRGPVTDDPHSRVLMTTNGGGPFAAPEVLPGGGGDASSPRVDLDVLGEPRLVWTRRVPEGGPEIVHYFDRTTGRGEDLAEGRAPAIYVDRDSVSHVVYFSDRTIWYTNNRSGAFADSETSAVANLVDQNPDGLKLHLGVDDHGNVFVVYSADGSLYFVSRNSGEEFSPPRLIEGGGVTSSEVHVRPGGVMTIAYAKGGDIFYVRGIASFLLPPAPVGPPTPETIEESPGVVVDHDGNVHIAFVRDGAVWYTNNAGEVSAEFSASPRTGEGPLEVEFQDLSSGSVQLWRWDFGDGSASQLANPVHTYNEPGRYAVTLSVFRADKESTVVKEDYVAVQEKSNSLEIPDQSVLPNQKDVWFPVIAAHEQPIQAYQIHAIFDPNVLELKECSQEYTSIEALEPDVWECNILERSVEIGVIFELEEPFEHPVLPPGPSHTLVQLVFDVSSGAPQGSATEVRLANDSETSRIFNIFTIDGFTKLPRLESSRVEIKNLFPLPRFFLRGDADRSGTIDITDAIRVLNFLFLGGPPPTCMDGADVTDSGRIDISAAISLLNYLFLGGGPPRVPFPNLGIDPTDDDLGCDG